MGTPRLISAALLSIAAATGCGMTSDPATPCQSMDLGHAREATFVTPERAPVVVVTDSDPFVLHEVCDDAGCNLRVDALPEIPAGSQVLLSSTGRYAVAVGELGFIRYRIYDHLEDGASVAVQPGSDSETDPPESLVAGMRGNDYVLYRSKSGKLGRYNPQHSRGELLANEVADLLVVAVGEHYLVGRKIHTGGEESLYLLPVHPDAKGHSPVELVRGTTFSSVLMTPDDAHVIATSGEGDDATTVVFDVDSRTLLDRFAGAAVSGRRTGEEIPGLRGVSPDGSHLAYRTPTGALAMRDLDLQGSCLVRSSNAGDHRVAGFAPNGMLYMEASEGLGKSRILAFDPITRELAALGEAEANYHLAAVAAQLPGEPEDGVDEGRESMTPWAVAVRGGSFAAITTGGERTNLGANDPSFMARDDGAVWLLEPGNDGVDRTLAVRRIAPTVRDGGLDFSSTRNAGPEWMDGDTIRPEFVTTIDRVGQICASTGLPGGWATRCGNGKTGSTFFTSDSSKSEDPHQRPTDDRPDPVDADDEP